MHGGFVKNKWNKINEILAHWKYSINTIYNIMNQSLSKMSSADYMETSVPAFQNGKRCLLNV